MSIYRFETNATMKEYNNKKWWIDGGIIRSIEVKADNIEKALQLWRNEVEARDYIQISNNALRTCRAMYIDDENGNALQIGYIITGKTEFEKDDYTGYSTQYIDLWVKIEIVTIPNFDINYNA